VTPADIDMFNKIIEGYGHLGIVSTIDRKMGMVVVRVTEDTYPEIKEILLNMPFQAQILNKDEE